MADRKLLNGAAAAAFLAAMLVPASAAFAQQSGGAAAGDEDLFAPDPTDGEPDSDDPALYELEALAGEPDDELSELGEGEDGIFPDAGKITKKPISVTLRALNKITARYTDIEAPMEEIAKFGSLEIVPRFCDTRPPEEFPETTAFLQVYDLGVGSQNGRKENDDLDDDAPAIDDASDGALRATGLGARAFEDEDAPSDEAENTLDAITGARGREEPVGVDILGDISDGDKIFSGWMFASSPAVNPLDHPVYDVWVIACKTVEIESEEAPDADESATSAPQ